MGILTVRTVFIAFNCTLSFASFVEHFPESDGCFRVQVNRVLVMIGQILPINVLFHIAYVLGTALYSPASLGIR